MIEVTFKLDIQEYTKLILFLLYTRIRIILATLVGLYFVISGLITAFQSDIFADTSSVQRYTFCLGFFIVGIYPFWMRYRIQRTFKSNKKLGETITYSFYENEYILKGESFSSEIAWSSLYQILETKSYFFLFHSRQSAHIIPKRVFQPEQIERLRSIIKSVPGIRTAGLLKGN